MKNRLTNLGNGVLQNLVASILLVIAISLIGAISAFYTTNPQTTLIVVLIILITINLVISLVLLRNQRNINKSVQELHYLKNLFPQPEQDRDPLSDEVRRKFEISAKQFDELSTPQKLIIRFVNRGSDVIQVKEVIYSGNPLGLHEDAILQTYRTIGHGDYSIPFNSSNSEVLPGHDFSVEIGLRQKWSLEDIYQRAGKWGYLKLNVAYKDKPIEMFVGSF